MPFAVYEKLHQRLASRSKFLARLVLNFILVLMLIAVSLFAGVCGYHFTENLSWLDSFLNASMILGGMGPVDTLHTEGGKLFAGIYALYSGLLLIATSGILLAPVLHRVMHSLHAADDEDVKKRK